MNLTSALCALLGIASPRDERVRAAAHASWRRAMHNSRNEATKVVAVTQEARRRSDAGERVLSETLRVQEEAMSPGLREEVKGFLDRLREVS